MNTAALSPLGRLLTAVATAAAVSAVFAACAADAPLAPSRAPARRASLTTLPGTNTDGAIATLQRATTT